MIKFIKAFFQWVASFFKFKVSIDKHATPAKKLDPKKRWYIKNQRVSFMAHEIEVTVGGSVYEVFDTGNRRVQGLYFPEVDRFLLTLVNSDVCWLRRNRDGVIRAVPVAQEDLDMIAQMSAKKVAAKANG